MTLPLQTQAFLNPDELLKEISLAPDEVVADFGCGNGHYAVAAAELVGSRGQVYALDVLDEALSRTAMLAKIKGCLNVITRLCDLEKLGSCPLEDLSSDVVIVGSVLHQVQNKENLLREAYRVLKTGGKLFLIEWESHSVFGPPKNARMTKNEIRNLVEKFGFRPLVEIPAGSFHYALLYTK